MALPTLLPGYTKAAPLTIDHTQVGAGGVSDFPLLVPMTLPDDVAAACAFEDLRDLRFTLADGVTTLYHELVSGSKSAKSLQVWVRVPSILSSSDTVLLAQVGNAAATMPSASDQQATWGSDYVTVHHFTAASLGLDSSQNGNTFATIGAGATAAVGPTGTALALSGTSAGYLTSPTLSNTPQSNLTVQCWLNSATAGMPRIFTIGRNSSNFEGQAVFGLYYGNFVFWDYQSDYGFSHLAPNKTVVANGAWQYIAFSKSGTAGVYYVNGVADQTRTAAKDVQYVSASPCIGKDLRGNIEFLGGSLGEFRLSNVTRPAAWVATEYANQSNPATFSTWGPLETLAGYVPHRRNIIYRSGPTLRGVI